MSGHKRGAVIYSRYKLDQPTPTGTCARRKVPIPAPVIDMSPVPSRSIAVAVAIAVARAAPALVLLASFANAAPMRLDETPTAPAQAPESRPEVPRSATVFERVNATPRALNGDSSAARMAGPAGPAGQPNGPEAKAASAVQPSAEDTARATPMASERARAEAQRAQKGAKPRPGALVDEGDDLDPDLKGAAKAARQLLRDAMPWTEPQEGGTNGRGPDVATPDGVGRGGLYAGSASEQYAAGAAGAAGAAQRPGDPNLVRDAIKRVREVLEHPMTWLVIALIAVGSAGVSIAKRRAK